MPSNHVPSAPIDKPQGPVPGARNAVEGSALQGAGAALISGAGIALAHGFLPALACVAPIPFLYALQKATLRQAFYQGLIVGAAISTIVAGFSHAGLHLYTLIVLTYAGFMALFAVMFAAVQRLAGGPGLRVYSVTAWSLAAAGTWVFSEWLHAVMPYSAPNIIGETQHVGPLLHLARLGGTWLIGFCIIWIAATLSQVGRALLDRSTDVSDAGEQEKPALAQALWATALALGVTAALCVAGWMATPSLQRGATSARDTLSVNLIQGGLPTWVYARAEQDKTWADVPERTYLALTQSVTQNAPRADLTVWPETAVWRIWGEDTTYETWLQNVQRATQGALLVGVPRRDDAQSYANAAVLLQSERPAQFADKRRLALLTEVSFGPGHAPGMVLLERFESTSNSPHLAANDTAESRQIRVGVVFCLETVAPQYALEVARAGAEVIVVLAEGSRFGATPVSWVHAKRSIIRAVETGRSVLHAGQHASSMLITPDGNFGTPMPAFRAAVQRGVVPLVAASSATPYVVLGPWPAWLGAAWAVLWAGMRRRRRAT